MNDNLEIVPTGDSSVATRQPQSLSAVSTVNIEALLNKAVDAKAAVEVLKELRAMELDMQARRAKQQFDEAMAALQAECPTVIKSTRVEQAYSYAKFEDILATVKDTIQKHGFSFRLDTDVESKDGWVIATCRVIHSGGHQEVSTAKFPIGAGTRLMSTTQIYAAALSFASRRVFCNAFGIIPAGEDQDGLGRKPKPPTPSSLHGDRAPTGDDIANKRKLADLLRHLHNCQGYNLDEKGRRAIEQYLIDEAIISDTETLGGLSGKALADAVAKVQAKLKPKT